VVHVFFLLYLLMSVSVIYSFAFCCRRAKANCCVVNVCLFILIEMVVAIENRNSVVAYFSGFLGFGNVRTAICDNALSQQCVNPHIVKFVYSEYLLKGVCSD